MRMRNALRWAALMDYIKKVHIWPEYPDVSMIFKMRWRLRVKEAGV